MILDLLTNAQQTMHLERSLTTVGLLQLLQYQVGIAAMMCAHAFFLQWVADSCCQLCLSLYSGLNEPWSKLLIYVYEA